MSRLISGRLPAGDSAGQLGLADDQPAGLILAYRPSSMIPVHYVPFSVCFAPGSWKAPPGCGLNRPLCGAVHTMCQRAVTQSNKLLSGAHLGSG